MRACTAVITEISWNNDNGADEAYRAEIEFISGEDWNKELRCLFGELAGMGEGGAADADYEVAKAKLKAVYPELAKDMKNLLDSSSPGTLVGEPCAQAVLGKTLCISDSSSVHFMAKLQKYIDSKDKDDNKRGRKRGDHDAGAEGKADHAMEFWPLIKVVRLYLKSDVLSTGLVLVDLVSGPSDLVTFHVNGAC